MYDGLWNFTILCKLRETRITIMTAIHNTLRWLSYNHRNNMIVFHVNISVLCSFPNKITLSYQYGKWEVSNKFNRLVYKRTQLELVFGISIKTFNTKKIFKISFQLNTHTLQISDKHITMSGCLPWHTIFVDNYKLQNLPRQAAHRKSISKRQDECLS